MKIQVMSKLSVLKQRLEKLPEVISERHLAGNFHQHWKSLVRLRENTTKNRQSALFIEEVFPLSKCEKTIQPKLTSSIRMLKKLRKDIDTDPERISAKATDNCVIKLGDYASSISTTISETWQRQTENSVDKWLKIASVVEQLGAAGGKEFKQTVESLQKSAIPINSDQSKKAAEANISLQKGVSKLGLEGPFGKFLEATVEEGATLSKLRDPEVKSKIDEFDLESSFRIKIFDSM